MPMPKVRTLFLCRLIMIFLRQPQHCSRFKYLICQLQVVAPLLKRVLILKRRFCGKHSRLELAILATDNMICRGILVDYGGELL